jgi:putative nucleotidyltransferase with HDIG domain
MKVRILFVDDELRVLEGFEDLLLRYARKWDMVFATSGESALAHMRQIPFDVIVADMRMPGMDGSTLLRILRDEYPDTIRIVLSGQSEMQGILPALRALHQFLYKPCDPKVLEGTIEKACALRASVANVPIRRAVGALDGLPTLASTYEDLQRALADHHPAAGSIARIIERDMGMSAKILQLVNSAFFGLGRRITRIEDAVAYLGIEMMEQLVGANVFRPQLRREGDYLEAFHRHSLLTAGIAAAIMADDRRLAADAWAAGLLHDIGKVVLASALPEYYATATRTSKCTGRPLHDVEQELYGTTHALAGAYLLGIWGLPEQIVEAVANHHAPECDQGGELDVATAVCMANALAHECCGDDDAEPHAGLNRDHIAWLGLEHRVQDWRGVARVLSEREICLKERY